MSDLRNKILGVMTPGEAMKRAQIVSAARLPDAELVRVGIVLKKLKDEGLVSMKGQRGSATYTLQGRRRKEAESSESGAE
jgi:hypothetical protein